MRVTKVLLPVPPPVWVMVHTPLGAGWRPLHDGLGKTQQPVSKR